MIGTRQASNRWSVAEISGPPLTASMDDVLAWRLWEAFRVASNVSAGDPIDRGLALLRGLNEHGFDVLATADEHKHLFPGRK